MFDNVLGRGNVPKGRFSVGVTAAVVVHAAILAFAFWVSTRPPAEPEPKVSDVTFYAPPPPPPPPPPPSSNTGGSKPKTEQKKKPVKKPDTVVKPKEIPTEKPQEAEPQQEETEVADEGVEGGQPGGVIGGVIGGVQGGVVGGVIGGTLGGTLGGQLGGEVLPFGEGMKRPERLSGRDVTYTREAREARVEGTMLVKCVITVKGELERCRIIKRLPHMEEAVMDALKTWRMTPVQYQGRAVKVEYVIPFRFKLQ